MRTHLALTLGASLWIVPATVPGQTSIPGASSPLAVLHADTAVSHVRAAERLLAITNAERTHDAGMESMLRDQEASLGKRTPWLPELLRRITQKYSSYAIAKPDMLKAYTANYTERELDDLVAFYKTDLGRMMLERGPRVTQAIVAANKERMRAAEPEIREAIKARIAHQYPVPQE